MNELALFAGAGGGILGGHLLGWRTVCAVEILDFPRRVLLQRQADGILPRFPIWDDVTTFDGVPWRGKIDIISGGFPCQDISPAGKGAGIKGEQSGLWGEMARIIGEVRPRYAFVENSSLLVGRGLTTVLGDFTEMGYDVRWGIIGVHNVGAPHRRNRIWILAYAASKRCRKEGQFRNRESSERLAGSGKKNDVAYTNSINWGQQQQQQVGKGVRSRDESGGSDKNVSDTDKQRAQVSVARQLAAKSVAGGNSCEGRESYRGWWDVEPDVGRVAHGVAARVDRLKAIGNGQVPAVAKLAWEILIRE